MSMPPLDLAGKKFGKLTVLKQAGSNRYKQTKWLCRCDCGKDKVILGSKIYTNRTKSCGCLLGAHQALDLTGQKFGMLTAYRRTDKRTKDNSYIWMCKCDCGKEIEKDTRNLRRFKRHSCGCTHFSNIIPDTNSERFFVKRIITAYQQRAKRHGMLFTLTTDKFERLIKGNCSYCGKPPSAVYPAYNKHKHMAPYFYNGIDRIDSTKGYLPENCVSCCKTCNYMKTNLSLKDFFDHVVAIYNYLQIKELP